MHGQAQEAHVEPPGIAAARNKSELGRRLRDAEPLLSQHCSGLALCAGPPGVTPILASPPQGKTLAAYRVTEDCLQKALRVLDTL